MNVLGLMGQDGTRCHDGAAAVLRGDRIVAAVEQERVSRNKHAVGESASEAARECLDAAGLDLADVDHVTYGWSPTDLEDGERVGRHVTRSVALTEEILSPAVFEYDAPPPINFVDHHVTHVEAAVYESDFRNAACLVADGRGERDSITLAEYADGELRSIDSYPIAKSLGIMYDAAAAFCGFGEFGGGKLMGLSSYGRPLENGWLSFHDETKALELPIEESDRPDVLFERWLDFFERRFHPYEPRDDGSVMYYEDFAATVQKELTDVMLSLTAYLAESTTVDSLVVGGGVALNCATNRELHRAGHFDDLFVYPASNDAGAAVGSIYEFCREVGVAVTRSRGTGVHTPYLGPVVPADDVERSVRRSGVVPEKHDAQPLLERVANDIAEGKVVGWYQGRSEFGPRALGNRSILGNPTSHETLYEINSLKGREAWRPLAPSVLAEHFEDVFEADCPESPARYMITTSEVSEEWRERVPAATHVDGTSRPQLVERDVNERYHRLISRFHDVTGIPLVINTSFNLSGDPIVERPSEAIDTFRSADEMDVLVVGNYYVS